MTLTWRNVEGPDFGRSLEGIRTFSNLFGDAIGGLDRGLATFDAAQDKRANNTFAMDLLKYQDPAAYKAALASGQVFANVDPRRLSQASIQSAGARGTELLNQKIGEFGLERDQYGFDRRRDIDTKQDEAAPLMAGAFAAGRQGADAFSKYMAANPALAKLGLADATALASGALDAEGKGVSIDTGRQAYSQSSTRFGWETQDRAVADEADKVWATLQQNGFDGESQMTMLNSMTGLNPKVYNAIAGRIGMGSPGGGGTPAAGMISGALGGGGGGDPTRVMNYEARASGFASVPDDVKTLGQASDFALKVNAANKARTGEVGSSAMGVYQIVGDTMRSTAAQLYGPGWRDKPFNFQMQDAIAQRIFEQNRGSADALKKQWVSLSSADAERVRKMPWEQARQFIAAGESSSDPRALALGITATQQGMRNASMKRNANNPANTYAKSAGDGRSIGEVAASLTADPVFKGMDVGYINEQLRLVQSYARSLKGPDGKPAPKTINAAVAADILRNSVTSSWASRNLWSWVGGGDKQGVYIDGDAARRYVDEYSQGNVDNSVLANANAAQAASAQAQAKGMYDQALARYQAAQQAQARGVKVNLRPLEGAVNRAASMLSAATGAIGNNPAIASFQRPAPVAVTGGSRTAGAQPVRARPAASRADIWRNALARGGN